MTDEPIRKEIRIISPRVTHAQSRVEIQSKRVAIGASMISEIKREFVQWAGQVNGIISDKLIHLSPQDYSIGGVFIIAIGFVLLSGRR